MGGSLTVAVKSRPSTAPPKRRTQGARAVRFIEENCVIPEGDLIGQRMNVHPWWRARIYEMLELRPQRCAICGEATTFVQDGDSYRCSVCTQVIETMPLDERRYSEALIGIAKKNQKSSMLAALGLYFLLGDGDPSPLVISAACSEQQGKNLLYGSAKTMCKMSEPLQKLTQAFESEILVPSLPRARMQNVTASIGSNDGSNIKVLLADELHEWTGDRGRNLWTVLSGGTGARANALRIAITTAGYDQDSLCYEKYTYGQKVNSGLIDDDSFYFHWLEAPQEANYRDPSVWAIANPLLGVSVRESYIADRVKRDTESVVRRYNLNQWVAGENIWIPFGVWDDCQSELRIDPTQPLYVGIDIAKRIDSSALATCQPRDMRPLTCPMCGDVGVEYAPVGDNGADGWRCGGCREVTAMPPPAVRYILGGVVWENPHPDGTAEHEAWRMNNNLVMDICRGLFREYPIAACEIDDEIKPGPMFGYDPWRFRPEAETLTGEGLAMVEFPQNDTRMIPASQDFYEAIMKGEAAHDGNADFKRHVHNVTADSKPRGWRMSKPDGSKRKIDWAIAAGIALHLAKATVAPSVQVSRYATEGIRVF